MLRVGFPPLDSVPRAFVEIVQKSFEDYIERANSESERNTSGKREYEERRTHGGKNSVTYAFGDASKTSFLQSECPVEILPMITWKPTS